MYEHEDHMPLTDASRKQLEEFRAQVVASDMPGANTLLGKIDKALRAPRSSDEGGDLLSPPAGGGD